MSTEEVQPAGAELADVDAESPVDPGVAEPSRGLGAEFLSRTDLKLTAFICAVIFAGLIGGLVWKVVTEPASFTISADGTAAITDQALGQFFSSDAVFVVIGLITGLAIGSLAWHWLRNLHWLVVLIGAGGAAAAALIAWRLGLLIGFNHFAERVAAASPGDTVPIDLVLRTPTAWLFWPLAAITPILLYSSLGRDQSQDADPLASDPGEATPAEPDQVSGS